VTYYFNSLTYYFVPLTLQSLRLYLLFCETDDARLSEINIPVLKTVARFLWKTSVSLHI